MMLKEKIIFWPLLAVFIGLMIFGLGSQGKKKEATEELLKDIELATKKTMAKKKAAEEKWDFDEIRAVDILAAYKLLLERSPFFKVRPEGEVVEKVEVIPLKEEPKEPFFKYKGRVMMGSTVMVIIEDHGTGKSSFVKEGDMVGDFMVLRIDDKEVALKKRDGEEIILSTVKKQREEKKEVEEVGDEKD